MKNVKLRLSAALLALVMCFGLLVSCGDKGLTLEGVKKDPYTAVMTGSEKYADSLSEKYGSTFAVFEKLAKSVGTYEFKVSIPDAADIGLNAVVDPANGAYSAKATAGVMGLTAEASLWGDKNNVALSIPMLLGEDKYGLKLDTLETDLEESDLLASLTGMTFDEVKTALETEAGISYEEIKGMFSLDSWKTAFDKYVVDSKDFINGKEAVVTEETLKVGETDLPVIAVEYSFTKDDYKKLVDMSVEMVESIYGKVFTAAGVDLSELMAEAEAEADTEEIIAGGLTEKYYLNKSTGAVVGGDFTAGEIAKISCIFGDPAEKIDMSVSVSVTVDGETADISATLKETSAEGKSGIEAGITVKAADEEHTAKLTADRTDADGKYEIKITADDEELASAAGVLTFNADEFTVSLDTVTAAGETVDLGLSFSAKAGGTVEAVPEYVNIATASLSDLSGLIETISGLFMSSDSGYDDSYSDEYYDEYYSDEYYDEYYDDNYEYMPNYEYDFGDEYAEVTLGGLEF